MALTGQGFDMVAPVLGQAKATAVRSCEAWWPRADAQPGRAAGGVGRSIYAASLSALASGMR
jgi:hypothetical protein